MEKNSEAYPVKEPIDIVEPVDDDPTGLYCYMVTTVVQIDVFCEVEAQNRKQAIEQATARVKSAKYLMVDCETHSVSIRGSSAIPLYSFPLD